MPALLFINGVFDRCQFKMYMYFCKNYLNSVFSENGDSMYVFNPQNYDKNHGLYMSLMQQAYDWSRALQF